jgi:glycosyltransferase involved in cell wall biosynthesis
VTDTIVGNRSSPDFLVKGLGALPGTIELAERMRSQGVRHIHAHFGTHAALVALLAAEIIGVGFSFTIHAHELFVDTTMLAEKVRRARFVVAISQFNRRLLRELVGPIADEKVEVVRCGVDLSSYQFHARAPTKGQKSILAVGSLREYKGLDRLVHACALLHAAVPEQDFVCNIVGEGPLRESLTSLIATLQLGGVVRLLGAQDQHTVRHLMDGADTMVLPSVVARNGQMEGIPVVLMEAMATGAPIIASDLSGIPELVRHGDTGLLVPPDDPGAIRDAVLECWSAPDAAAERARRGRRLVEREYNLVANVSDLARLFSGELATSGELDGQQA